ncbi:hypothetical protein [Chondromyces crocatus]|nr:hypothetical protein [Chondromyces crocatus]
MSFAFAACSALIGCGGTLHYDVQGSGQATGADVKMSADVSEETSMTRINIKAAHLPPPERLEQSGTAFVVWTRPSDGPWQRVGALNYDKDERSGELLAASVPLVAFELMVTAEKAAAPMVPSTAIVASQHVAP